MFLNYYSIIVAIIALDRDNESELLHIFVEEKRKMCLVYALLHFKIKLIRQDGVIFVDLTTILCS